MEAWRNRHCFWQLQTFGYRNNYECYAENQVVYYFLCILVVHIKTPLYNDTVYYLVFGILFFHIIYSIVIQRSFYMYHEYAQEIVNHLIFCIALVVVTIPEGLKLSETVAISSSLHKLFNQNSLIRSISAPEIMSRCTDICVETTGCLTENKVKI